MPMALVTLEESKLWLRVDGDEEDAIIQLLIDSAEKYLLDATGRRWTAETPTAKLCAMALIADWYEHRELTGQDASTKIRPAIQSMIMQLSYASDEPDDGDEDGDGDGA